MPNITLTSHQWWWLFFFELWHCVDSQGDTNILDKDNASSLQNRASQPKGTTLSPPQPWQHQISLQYFTNKTKITHFTIVLTTHAHVHERHTQLAWFTFILCISECSYSKKCYINKLHNFIYFITKNTSHALIIICWSVSVTVSD
jgi:hypothetical protein